MSTLSLPSPVEDAVEDGLSHIWCCDPGRALCGATLDDAEDDDGLDDDDPDRCVVCLDLESVPTCGDPLCGFRSWVRRLA